ncbi:MAG: ferrochelatase [Chlorobiaceae bacterium]|nr:ferrochelatase [Chlorobiaceae bacterium]
MAVKTIAVVLVAHGEAETSGFFENYRVSRHTLDRASTVMHIPPLLRQVISVSSSLKKKMRAGLAAGSPQNQLTRAQAVTLQERLDRHTASFPGIRFEVRAAYSASEPYVEDVLADTRGYDGRIVVPMAPVDNALICGVLCAHLAGSSTSLELSRTRVIGRLWTDGALHRAYMEHLFESGRAMPVSKREHNVLMLLFHGTIIKDSNGAVPSFHTGHKETEAFSAHLTSAIESDPRSPWGNIMTAFLNHDVGGEWSTPSFGEVCMKVGRSGCRHVSLFAAGYFSDGNETIHQAAHLAAVSPTLKVESIPCLNDSHAFSAYLAGRVASAASQIIAFSGVSRSDVM